MENTPSPLCDSNETPFQASGLRSSRFSNHNKISDALLPPFRDTQLATNAARSLNAPLLAPSVSNASALCLSTLSSTSEPSLSLPPTTHNLTLSFCGEEFIYELDTLENDPMPIIELLKATESEAGVWMTIGAHYRRSGNANAAISVIENLITRMTTQKLPESTLKPAYLLLSGCETDLAKRVKAETPGSAEEHYKRSQTFLRKVYGPQETSPLLLNSSGISLPVSQSSTHISTNILGTTPTPGSPRTLRLEREIKTLLKEKNEQKALLNDMRAAKRKLEDDLAYECNGRRRVLREFDDLQKELETARKMETYALGQVKREVAARRKAEEMARTEKGLRMELQRLVEECATGPLGEIANTMRTEENLLPGIPPSA